MELEDAIRLLNLATPLFKHLLIVHNNGNGMEHEVVGVSTNYGDKDQEPRIVIHIDW